MEANRWKRGVLYTTTLAGIVAGSMMYNGCDDDEDKCEAVNYQATEGLNLSPQQEELYLSLSCPEGCSYDSDVGCCWCPNK